LVAFSVVGVVTAHLSQAKDAHNARAQAEAHLTTLDCKQLSVYPPLDVGVKAAQSCLTALRED